MSRQRYHLILEALPGNYQAPPLVRLRGLIKCAKRAWGYRLVSITEHKPEPETYPAITPEIDQEIKHQ
jgi:hypothetical protein